MFLGLELKLSKFSRDLIFPVCFAENREKMKDARVLFCVTKLLDSDEILCQLHLLLPIEIGQFHFHVENMFQPYRRKTKRGH